MARILRQSTSVDVPIGAFVDQTDGVSPETTLTITQPDIRLKKNGGAWAQKNAAQTLTHEENGNYEVTLDATDTNTLGLLRLHVNESGALPVTEDFWVVTQNYWDSLFATDLLQVDLTQWLGVAPSAVSAGRVQALVNALDSSAVNNAALAMDTGLKNIRSGTCQGGTASSVTLDAGASATNDLYKGARVYLPTGLGTTGAGQSRLITAYNGSTKVATVEPNWTVNPASDSFFVIRDDAAILALATGGIMSTSFAAGAINAAVMAADMDSYTTRSWIGREGATADKYIVQWFKNGQLVSSGITVPLISVFDDTGTDLIAETAMTEIGSRQCFKFIETTNTLTAGEVYIMEVKATINGLTRIDRQPITRDSV